MATPKQYINDQRYCPRCYSLLILGKGLKSYETLAEHVLSPNDAVSPKKYYICSKETCIVNSRGYFWDDYGDAYCDKRLTRDLFLLGCTSAINSGSRKFEIEEHRLRSIPLFHIYFFKIELERYPITNCIESEIIGYKHKVSMAYREDKFWTKYTPGINMLFFSLKLFKDAKKRYLKNNLDLYSASEMLEILTRKSWDTRWWTLLLVWSLNKCYPGLKDTLLCLKKK